MNILILTPRFPFPENGGDVLRINYIARYLKKQGHFLSLLSFVDSSNVENSKEDLYNNIYSVKRKPWLSGLNALLFLLRNKPIQCGYYYSPCFLNKLNEVINIEKPDIIICHLLRTSYYVEKLHLENKTIVEMTDALSKTYSIAQNAKGFFSKKYIYRLEESRIKKYECYVTKMFPKVVLVSQQDVDYLKLNNISHNSSLKVYPNGVEIMEKCPLSYNRFKICFIGNMRTLQNQDAVLRFAKDIFPLVLKKEPQAKFFIIGAQPPQKIQELTSDSIIVTGFVDDIYEAISDSCVAVAPVQIAAGIQNKVLVAMGAGVPVVMTSLISKAIPELKNGENCYVSDKEEEFADRCIEIMNNPNKRQTLSEEGYKMVRNHYSWSQKLKGYELLSNEIKESD